MKIRQKTNAVKDVSGNGNANRVAGGATLLQEGNSASDAHVLHSSPISLKRKALEEDPQYQDGAINRTREKSTTRLRRAKDVRPL
jgi:hypothetical protein